MTTPSTAVEQVSRAFRSHGGAITLLGVADGEARVRFAGLCTACPCRPVCFEYSVRPALAAVPGVRSVSADGIRVSEHAARRLTLFLEGN